ncbi:MAG: LptF/LptG family permease [Bdellovibrionales bacterium]|nr:LptF/LptG family permease [Bdellovibrionales bacterium]
MKASVSKIDRYLFWELVKSSVSGSLVAIVVLLCLQALRLSEFIIRSDLDKDIIFRMLSGLGLSFAPLVVPIACLFALLGVFGRLSTDREFVAAQSMGYSPGRLLHPSLFFGIMAVGASLWFSFSVGPLGNRNFEATIDEAFKRKVASALSSGTFNEGFLDMVLFVDRVNPVTQELERVFLHDSKSFREEVSISAKRGRWIQPLEVDGLGILRLNDGVVISREIQKDIVRRVKFDEYRIYADFSSQAGRPKESPPSLGWTALTQKRKLSGKDINLRPIWIEMARRFAVSFSCLIFVPLSFAVSLDNRRTAKGRAVMTGLTLLFSYWTLYFALITWLLKTPSQFAASTEWFTWLLIWIPNILLIAFGAWIYRKKASGMVA